jgi:DNA helicase-2/ATP-dependent DNA helicase PcrA
VQDAPNHKLGTLVEHLQIPFVPTHRALDDVLATVALAHELARRAEPGKRVRGSLLTREAPLFARLRSALERWADTPQRPAALLRTIRTTVLRYSGPDAAKRLANLERLAQQVEAIDDPALSPRRALALFLDRAALARDVDGLEGTPGVRVLTMHQSKGLEFDQVFVPGLADGKMPNWFAVKDFRDTDDSSGLDEERRLLYVAMTRARRQLHLSWYRRDESGRAQEASRFLAELGPTVRAVAGP